MGDFTKDDLSIAYRLGFEASCEGYNGEYPFGDHNKGPEDSANWVAGRSVALAPLIAAASSVEDNEALIKELVEALKELRHAVCGETGFANAVRLVSGTAYPWPALDAAEELANAALAKAEQLS